MTSNQFDDNKISKKKNGVAASRTLYSKNSNQSQLSKILSQQQKSAALNVNKE